MGRSTGCRLLISPGDYRVEIMYDGSPYLRRSVPILSQVADRQGHARYTGLARGTYRFYAGDEDHYAGTTIQVTDLTRHEVGRISMRHETSRSPGVTVPHAVVEAMTGDQGPPDGPVRPGTIHVIEIADRMIRSLTMMLPSRRVSVRRHPSTEVGTR